MIALDQKAGQQRRKPELRDWREFAKPIERVEIDALEANAQELDAKRKAITHLLRDHRSRCVSRRTDELQRKLKNEAAA